MLRKNQVPLRFSAMAGTCLVKMYPTLVLPSGSVLTPTSPPIIITIVYLAMDVPGKDGRGRKKPLANNISN
jgi:hypothetical protein